MTKEAHAILSALKINENQEEHTCSVCKDVGYIATGDGNYKICDCQKMKSFERQVPEKYKSKVDHIDFGIYSNKKAVIEALKKCDDDNFSTEWKGFYIYGSYGAGKTLLASKMLKLLAKIYQVAFTSTTDYLERKKRSMFGDDVGYKRYLEADVLVLDDLGKEKESDYVGQELFMLINHRNNHDLITIVTSNYKLEDIADKYGERGEAIKSRLYQLGFLNIIAEDQRRKR